MAMSRADYHSLLLKLLPKGRAWVDAASNKLGSLLDALSAELARIDARGDALLDEADPRTTFEMLPDWERNYGLPDSCSADSKNLQERIQALVAKVTMEGGQSMPFFIELAASLGYDITITEFSPFTVASDVAQPLYSVDWRFAWQVNAAEETVNYFTVNSDVSTPLASWGNELLECTFNRYKPAHTVVIFAYGGQ